MIHFAIVTQVDSAGCRARVIFEDLDGLASDWLPVLQTGARVNKSYWLPDVNEQVACIMEKNNSNGVILGALYNSEDTTSSDASGEGVRALQLVANGAAVFLAKVQRAAAGAFSLWTKGRAKVEAGADFEVAAGQRLKLASAGPLSIEAGGENGHKLLADIAKFLLLHKHTVAGATTTVLVPDDLKTATELAVRIEKFIQD